MRYSWATLTSNAVGSDDFAWEFKRISEFFGGESSSTGEVFRTPAFQRLATRQVWDWTHWESEACHGSHLNVLGWEAICVCKAPFCNFFLKSNFVVQRQRKSGVD